MKGYRLLSFARNTGKNISKNVSSRYRQKLFDHAKQCATDELKTVSKRTIQKTAEATGNLIRNKIVDKSSKNSPQNNSVTNEEENIGLDGEIQKEKYISPEQRQKIIDDLRLI